MDTFIIIIINPSFLHCFELPSVLWRCWMGGRKGIWPVKNEWLGAGLVICLERGADLHMAQLMPLPLTVSSVKSRLYRLTWVVPEKGQLNVCVCVCVCVWPDVRNITFCTVDFCHLLFLCKTWILLASGLNSDVYCSCRHCLHITTNCLLWTVAETLQIYQACGYVICNSCQFFKL